MVASYVAAFAFLVSLPAAAPSLEWLYKTLLVIGAGGLIVSSAVLAWRGIIRGFNWVKKSKTTGQTVWRWIVFATATVLGVPAVGYYWFFPLFIAFSFLGVTIEDVRQIHF